MAETAAQKRARLTAAAADLAAKTQADIAAAEATLPPAPTSTIRSLGMRTDAEIDAGITPTPIAPITYATEEYLPEPSDTDIATAEAATAQAATNYAAAAGGGGGGGAGGGNKKAVGSTITTINGRQVQIITYDDGSTQQIDIGSAVDPRVQQDAIASLTARFLSYGLSGDIAKAVTDMVMQGYSADTISLIAQDPNSTNPLALAMQTRFPANKLRIQAGLTPLSPSEYIATERAYGQVMNAAGLPKGFYDSPADFTNLITKDISVTELKNRVDLAASAVANADPFYKSQLQTMYGLSNGDMIAHLLDPNAALPLLQKQAAAVQLGTAAARQGFGLSTTAAETLYGEGVTQAQAEVGFRNIMAQITPAQKLATTWGGDAAIQGQNLVASTFGTAGAAYAEQQLKALATRETSAFQGSSGIGKGSLGTTAAEAAGGIS